MKIVVDCSHSDFATQARTLNPGDLGYHEESGWTVEGKVMEDYYEWINDFVATHPTYGRIEGNFQVKVSADSLEALNHFLEHHPYLEWDYYDI